MGDASPQKIKNRSEAACFIPSPQGDEIELDAEIFSGSNQSSMRTTVPVNDSDVSGCTQFTREPIDIMA